MYSVVAARVCYMIKIEAWMILQHNGCRNVIFIMSTTMIEKEENEEIVLHDDKSRI